MYSVPCTVINHNECIVYTERELDFMHKYNISSPQRLYLVLYGGKHYHFVVVRIPCERVCWIVFPNKYLYAMFFFFCAVSHFLKAEYRN